MRVQVSASQWKQSGIGIERWKVLRVTQAGWRLPFVEKRSKYDTSNLTFS